MKCKKCGGHMTVNYSKVLTSLPPMYEAKCDECGSIDYFYCHECSEITDGDVRQVLGHDLLTFEQIKEIEKMHLQHDWEKLRNEFAGRAMQGLLSNPNTFKQFEDDGRYKEIGDITKVIALSSVMYADALIEELRKAAKE